MSQIKNSVNRSLQVSENVISGVVINAVKEVEGVYGIAPVKKSLKQIWLKEENFGEINVDTVDDVLVLSIGIILESGAKAVAVSEQVQQVVKDAVQNMLGLAVTKINVTVRGVKI